MIAAMVMGMSRIERVTVFREGARVERALVLEDAATEARFVGLPLTLDDGSVRVRVEGEGLAADVRVGLESPAETDTLAPARDAALETAREAAQRCRAEIGRIQAALSRLEVLKVAPRPPPRDNEPPLPIPLEARQRLLALRTGEEQRLATALAAANAAARAADAKLAEETERVRRDTTARNAKEHELRKVATVSLAGAKKGAKVTLEYAVPGARWSPSYVLTLAGTTAKLGMRALVAQRSGEDWSGVALRLSTADADAWVELPELAKSRIGRAQPPRPKLGYREPPEGAQALYADYDRVAGPPSVAAPEPPPSPAQSRADDDGAATPMGYGGPPGANMTRGGGPPVPARPMAPQMVHAQMHAVPRSSGVAGAAFGVAALAAAPAIALAKAIAPSAPAPQQMKKRATADHGELHEEQTDPQAHVELAPDWQLAADALSYARLRMRAPSDPQRGELTAVAQTSVYLEALGVRIKVDVASAIHVALERATIDASALPPGYELAHTDDAYDYLYAAELPCDVPADGAFRAVPIADWDAKTTLRHVAVPREAQQVYRLLDIDSPLDAALLAGPLDVFDTASAPPEEGGEPEVTYRTTTRMPSTPPRGRVEIGLGIEPAIKIARTTTFQEETAGLLGGTLALGHKVNVELRNLLPRAVTIEVRERVPVVRKDDADVKIEVGVVEPPWEKWDQEQSLRGGHVWKVTLDAGTTKTLSARYAIKIASKLELVGGNRRES